MRGLRQGGDRDGRRREHRARDHRSSPCGRRACRRRRPSRDKGEAVADDSGLRSSTGARTSRTTRISSGSSSTRSNVRQARFRRQQRLLVSRQRSTVDARGMARHAQHQPRERRAARRARTAAPGGATRGRGEHDSISAHAAQSGRWTYPVSKAGILHLHACRRSTTRATAYESTRSSPAGRSAIRSTGSQAAIATRPIAWPPSFTCSAGWDADRSGRRRAVPLLGSRELRDWQ